MLLRQGNCREYLLMVEADGENIDPDTEDMELETRGGSINAPISIDETYNLTRIYWPILGNCELALKLRVQVKR
jgi:hypothetical protein